jgi:hypothetical protein
MAQIPKGFELLKQIKILRAIFCFYLSGLHHGRFSISNLFYCTGVNPDYL